MISPLGGVSFIGAALHRLDLFNIKPTRLEKYKGGGEWLKGWGRGKPKALFSKHCMDPSGLVAYPLPSNGHGTREKGRKELLGAEWGVTHTHKSAHYWRTGTLVLAWGVCAEQNGSLVQHMEGQWLLWLECISEPLQDLPKVCAQVYGSWNGNKQNENKAT